MILPLFSLPTHAAEKTCSEGKTSIYHYRARAPSDIVLKTFKKAAEDNRIAILTLGGTKVINYFDAFTKTKQIPGTETLYETKLIYCLDENNKTDCPTPKNFGFMFERTGIFFKDAVISGCASYPTDNSISVPTIGGEQIVQDYRFSVEIPCTSIAGGSCPDASTPAGYIARLYQFALMIGGLIAFGGLIYGATLYIFSAGNIGSTKDALDQIWQTLIGLTILLGAYLILYTINPDLVSLQNPSLEPINIDALPGAQSTKNSGSVFTSGETTGNPIPNCQIAQSGWDTGITVNGQIGRQSTSDSIANTELKCLQCRLGETLETSYKLVDGACVPLLTELPTPGGTLLPGKLGL